MSGLMKAIAARVVEYPWTGPMILYVWTRVNTTNQRFQRLATLISAGKLPRERFTWPRPPRATPPPPGDADAPARPATPRVWKLFSPHRFAWLCVAMPSRPALLGAAGFAGQLQNLLEDPEMKALLASSPRMRKLLRPLFWMLGIEAARAEGPRRCRRGPVPRGRETFPRSFPAPRAPPKLPPRPEPPPLGTFATRSPSAPPLGSFSSPARGGPPPLIVELGMRAPFFAHALIVAL